MLWPLGMGTDPFPASLVISFRGVTSPHSLMLPFSFSADDAHTPVPRAGPSPKPGFPQLPGQPPGLSHPLDATLALASSKTAPLSRCSLSNLHSASRAALALTHPPFLAHPVLALASSTWVPASPPPGLLASVSRSGPWNLHRAKPDPPPHRTLYGSLGFLGQSSSSAWQYRPCPPSPTNFRLHL